MKPRFWRKLPGASTGLTIMLMLVSAGCSIPVVLQSGDGASSMQMVSRSDQIPLTALGETLFLKNCAHCHGSDGRGNEGPDLHNLDWSDEQITRRIRTGKKGQMTAFAGKLSDDDIRAVVGYLRTLK